jgi:sulfatase-modifying factor enzyme 1
MVKFLLLFLCFGSLAQISFGQAVPEKFIPKKSASKPAVVPAEKPVAKPEKRRNRRVVRESVEPVTQQPSRVVDKKLDVIFSSSEEALIEIDGKWYGTLLPDAPKTIPLDFGQHKLAAQSKLTRELYNVTITVLGDKQEVAIPMKELSGQNNPPPEDLKYAPIAVVRPIAGDPIRIEKGDLVQAVPDYVSRNAVIQAASEVAASMVYLNGGKYRKDYLKSGGSKKSKDSVAVNGFHLGRYEITQQQWQLVMGYNNSENKNCNDCPVENVSWNEVAEFIRRLNENGQAKFRLPTNAEWDYAVRMDIREYIDKRGGPRYGDNVAWNENNAQRKTHSVGTRIPHRSGAYDLMGNVAEWCSDWYDEGYLKSNSIPDNPKGPASGKTKIVRGGTILNKDFVKINHLDPDDKQKTVGFRLVQY